MRIAHGQTDMLLQAQLRKVQSNGAAITIASSWESNDCEKGVPHQQSQTSDLVENLIPSESNVVSMYAFLQPLVRLADFE
jgi:hypothetical protein